MLLADFLCLLRFQFYQESPGRALLRLVPGEGFGDEDKRRILQRLGRKLDGRLELAVELADSIPLSVSGKAIYVDQRIPGHADAP